MPFIPPWLARDYDPIGAFQRSLQIGAQIGEAQTRIAEQQRQANMEHAAKQQAMQANILKAQQEMEMEKAYRQQQLSMEQERLKQADAHNAIQAAAAIRRMDEIERHNRAVEDKPQLFHWQGGVERYNPVTGNMEILSPPRPSPSGKTPAQILNVSQAEKLYGELEKLRAQKTAAETEPGKKLSREQMRALNDAIWNKDLDYREAAFKATNAPTATATSPGVVPIPAPTAATVTPAPAAPAATKKLTNEAARMYWDKAKAILKTWKKPSEITEKAAELAKADGWTL